MVIEHSFVTTLESSVAMRRMAEYLAGKGFALVPGSGAAFVVGQQPQEWNSLEMQRGKKRASRAKNVSQLPQKIRAEFDRGRITLALSITANGAWGGGSFLTIGGESPGNLKKMGLHHKLLNAIASGLENLVAFSGSGQAVYSDWDLVEAEILRAAKRRFRRNVLIVLVVLLAFTSLIVLAVMHG